ncbi:MAG: hypothetical protein N6V49_02685, partial [Serratia symbiotica]|nr:hypothetical protein [Serratia symbiotica]
GPSGANSSTCSDLFNKAAVWRMNPAVGAAQDYPISQPPLEPTPVGVHCCNTGSAQQLARTWNT